MTRIVLKVIALALCALPACSPKGPAEVSRFAEPDILAANAPILSADQTRADGCYSADLGPNGPGSVGEMWFETPCPDQLSPYFFESLQRALKARGYYATDITGVLDSATSDAIRSYQVELGLDSATLSLAASERLGLTIYQPQKHTPPTDTPTGGPAKSDVDAGLF